MVINADRQVLGRMASKVAKEALNGNDVVIVNAEKAYISGNPKTVLEEANAKAQIKNKGNFNRGPYHPKRPDAFVRRAVRGMLPWKRLRGREAYKKVKVYVGIPDRYMEKAGIPMPDPADQIPLKKLRRKATVGQICKSLGGKW